MPPSRRGPTTLRLLLLASIVLFVLVLVVLTNQLPDRGQAEQLRKLQASIAATAAGTSLPAPRKPSLPRCGTEPATGVPRGGSCRFVLRNRQMDNVELLYVSGSEESRYWIIDYNHSFEVSSYTGDVWRLRSRHGLLLKEFATPVCAAGTVPEVILNPCAPPGVVPLAPLAPPSLAAQFTPARYRSCGVDEVLSGSPSPGMHLLCLLHVRTVPRVAYAIAIFAHSLRGAAASETPVPSHVFLVLDMSIRCLAFTERTVPCASQAHFTLHSYPCLAVSILGVSHHRLAPVYCWLTAHRARSPETLSELALAELERPRRTPPQQPAGVFTLAGIRIEKVAHLSHAVHAGGGGGLLVIEGGQWVWPAAFVGQEHVIPMPIAPSPPPPLPTDPLERMKALDGAYRGGPALGPAVTLRVLSIKPRVLEVRSCSNSFSYHVVSPFLSYSHQCWQAANSP